jgi:hypothetical protein
MLGNPGVEFGSVWLLGLGATFEPGGRRFESIRARKINTLDKALYRKLGNQFEEHVS